MRELKFRVWGPAIPKDVKEAEDDKASGDMVNWEYVKKSSYLIDGLNGKYPMMQWTGLKDKNGKEIYEGDFLEGVETGEFNSILSRWVDVIVWDKKKASFVAMDIGEGETLGLDEVDSDKVIGNIFTHPEWLQKIRKEFDTLRGDNK